MVLIVLAICLPSVTGFSEAVSSQSQSGVETEATGELTDGERLFQGAWQLSSYESGGRSGTLHIAERGFVAESVHGRYEGYVTIRPNKNPSQLDFTIESCDCSFIGMTSQGIYYEDDGTIVFMAPAPGEPRPQGFTDVDETSVILERATRAEEGDSE